ncbi:bacterial dnaA protein domain-containing protein [Ditylenchus destructor]|uniref:Bacterial dnaA protein domain-containing protein n=1 Tax=Ditylenchus destructor TaxID=166010 RepID=A0AAD4MI12_9BILA|nr:bacterial dnaA protein domain-containing protein [Ditylenchus destructor]
MTETDVPRDVAGPGEEPAAAGFKNRLNSGLTFDTWSGHGQPHGARRGNDVAGMPGHLYNPLFIYGGVGLGKTHLMHAVGNRLLADKPDSKVLYSTPSRALPLARPAADRRCAVLRQQGPDAGRILQCVRGLLAKKSHIVMTSDTYPKGLADIHERLVSRFDSGLTVAIEPPELEMRVAILINKARAESAEMPEEVAFFVAKNVRSNVRELEGALRKILAYSRFNQKEISIALARERCATCCRSEPADLRREYPEDGGRLLKDQVADVQQETPGQHRAAAADRDVPAKELTQKSLPEIGELFGGRDHTTVLHACARSRASAQQLTELNQQLHVLEQTLKG